MIDRKKSIQYLVTGAVIATMITACGKSGNSSSTSSKQSEEASNACAFYKENNVSTYSECKKELTANSDKPNFKTPDGSYTPVSSYGDLLYIFAALDPRPTPDYAYIAESISRKYSDSSDSFVKQEIIQQLKPAIDQKIAAFKGKNYFALPAESFNGYPLNPYNFDTKSFQNHSLMEYWSYREPNFGNLPKVYWMNANKFTNVRVEDYETAKRIESLRVAGKLKQSFYIYANNEDMRIHGLYVYITKIVYTDPTGTPVFTQYPE